MSRGFPVASKPVFWGKIRQRHVFDLRLEILNTLRTAPFDEIKVGDSASLTRTLTKRDIELFAVMSGDINPAHMDEEFAKSDMFHKVIAHSMWGGALWLSRN
jgi:acyl dehydratase